MANSIEFDGVNDVFTYDFVAPAPELVGATTLLIVLRILTVSDVTWMSFIESENGGGIGRPSIGRRNNGNIYYSDSITLSDAIAIGDADDWMVIADTRPAGAAQTVRAHKCVIGGANTHANMAGTFSNNAAYPAGLLRIAGNDDFANIRVVVAATFAAELTDADIEGVATAKSTASILALGPNWLVESGDGLVTDLSVGGNTDRSAAVGGADSTDGPAGWIYDGDVPVVAGPSYFEPRHIKTSRGTTW